MIVPGPDVILINIEDSTVAKHQVIPSILKASII
jgi:hypothetical protein